MFLEDLNMDTILYNFTPGKICQHLINWKRWHISSEVWDSAISICGWRFYPHHVVAWGQGFPLSTLWTQTLNQKNLLAVQFLTTVTTLVMVRIPSLHPNCTRSLNNVLFNNNLIKFHGAYCTFAGWFSGFSARLFWLLQWRENWVTDNWKYIYVYCITIPAKTQ